AKTPAVPEETQGFELAPQVGLEPTTYRLTADCSAIELLRIMLLGRPRNSNSLANGAPDVETDHVRRARRAHCPRNASAASCPGVAMASPPAGCAPTTDPASSTRRSAPMSSAKDASFVT